MMHARPENRDGWRRSPRRGRPSGWLFGLLVMCFAVLPHLTLAATMMRPPGSGVAHHAASMDMAAAEQAPALAPCHEDGAAKEPASAAPSCCIIGCGLIAEAPAAPLLPVVVDWSRLPPLPAILAQGLSTEPAERPPRSALFA